MQTLKQVAQQARFVAMQPVPVPASTDDERQALAAAIDQANHRRVTPKQVAAHLRSTGAMCIGDTEQLADVHTELERQVLWFAHRRTFGGATQTMIDTIMADCQRRIARAVNTGRLSLWPQ